jgi:hypothetical protein
MTTVDNLLIEIADYGFDNLKTKISKRDLRILKNLAHLVKTPEFISENQGKLLIKILKENIDHLSFVGIELFKTLKVPTWSKSFKKINQVRKLYIDQQDDGEKYIIIEFTFSPQLKKIMQQYSDLAQGNVRYHNSKYYVAWLTEKNIALAVSHFKPLNFEISTEILSFYEVISSWDLTQYQENFNVRTTTNKNLIEKLENNIGMMGTADALMLADRKIQFQYQFDQKFENSGVKEHIALRTDQRVYVDPTMYQLYELVGALVDLNRLPILVVFNGYSEIESLNHLKLLDNALEKNSITKNVGIYFRFENNEVGKQFNQYLAEKQFNAQLDSSTKIAGILSGKLPKFFLTTKWRPQSVISFTNNLKHNKTSVYCNDIDLIVYYTDKKSLTDFKNVV